MEKLKTAVKIAEKIVFLKNRLEAFV